MAKQKRAYESFEGFLREAIRTYWSTKKNQRANFLALLFASQSAWGAAWDEMRDPELAKRVLTGAAGAATVFVLLRILLGGPLGLLITGASLVSLVTVYVRNNRQIQQKTLGYRQIIRDTEPLYESIQDDYAGGRIDRKQMELMVDGLISRFIAELDAFKAEEVEGASPRTSSDAPSFEDHVSDKKASEEDEDDDK